MAFVKKVVSGGQTGYDRLGLEVARSIGIETGGYCPRDWLTENGSDPSLAEFGLQCTEASDYPPRTAINVQISDGTVWFGIVDHRGYALTNKLCVLHKKPWIENPSVEQLRRWIEEHGVRTLNVAGSRGSRTTTAALAYAREILREALS